MPLEVAQANFPAFGVYRRFKPRLGPDFLGFDRWFPVDPGQSRYFQPYAI